MEKFINVDNVVVYEIVSAPRVFKKLIKDYKREDKIIE